MEPDIVFEMSSSTVDMRRLQRAIALDRFASLPAISPGRSHTVSTEFPSVLEQPMSRAGLEAAFAMQNHPDGPLLHRHTLENLDALARAMSSTMLDYDLFRRDPHPEKGFAVKVIFRRNGEVVHTAWEEGRFLFHIIDRLKRGELNHILDRSGVRLAPKRRKTVWVWRRPRERAYYATSKELKGEGDSVKFVVWVDDVAVRTRKYDRVGKRP